MYLCLHIHVFNVAINFVKVQKVNYQFVIYQRDECISVTTYI